MKIKSFAVGLAAGLMSSLRQLDELVAKLGEVDIHDWRDTIYTQEVAHEGRAAGPFLVRVVKYSVHSKEV